jgi:hypothetical protein
MAALRNPRVWPVAARGEDQSKTRDDFGRLRARLEAQEALSASWVAKWQAELTPRACQAAAGLATDRPVDLLAEYFRPWCLNAGLLVMQAAPEDHARLADLGDRVFAATGAPDDSDLRPRAAEATAELERFFEGGPVPMGEPTFVAISQTLPRLLANIWMGLLQHPAEVELLRSEPHLLAAAVEELLRFGGIVRRVWRQALADVEVGGIRVASGERMMLMLASANRDPEQFPDPDRLVVTRRVDGQVALGMGRNSCIGNLVIRMAVAATAGALLANFAEIGLCGTPEYRVGSGYCFPASVPVRLRREWS